jgi:hypothetical protein
VCSGRNKLRASDDPARVGRSDVMGDRWRPGREAIGGGQGIWAVGMELRVHGIGAPSMESVLSCDRGEFSVVSWRSRARVRSALRCRGGRPEVQGYQWAPLTSGSRWFALWPLLLPFTLSNVAGFMAPGGSWRTRIHGAGATLQALCLTASAVIWLDVAAWLIWAHFDRLPGWLPGAGPAQAGWLGVITGGVAAVALVVVAIFTARDFERYEDAVAVDLTTKTSGIRSLLVPKHLDDPTFFNGTRARTRRAVHIGVAVGAWAVTTELIVAGDGMAAPGRTLGQAVLVVAIANVAAAAVMVLASLPTERVAPDRGGDSRSYERALSWRLLSAGAAVVASALLSGLVLAGVAFVVDAQDLPGGGITILYPAYGWAVLAGAGAVAACVTARLVTRSPAEEAQRANVVLTSPVARVRARLALINQHVGVIVGSVAGAFVVAATWTLWRQCSRPGGLDAWQLTSSPPVALARATFLFVVVYFFVSVAKARGNQASLRRVGNVWDILTFWPRQYHPFAVRSYAERAVPELREVLTRSTMHERVTVTAHSQGSVLVYATLLAVPKHCLDNVEVVTFGSPLRCLYAQAFPHHVTPSGLMAARASVGDRWVNIFRYTDHVGRALFASDLEVAAALEEPRQRPAGPGREPLEPDHRPDRPVPEPNDRGVVEGHNRYWDIHTVRTAVSGNPAGTRSAAVVSGGVG